jgi:PBP1b-binding outer membrane lipoprotein LpoB
MKKITIIFLITIGLFLSGCLNENTPKAISNDVEPQVTTEITTPTPL